MSALPHLLHSGLIGFPQKKKKKKKKNALERFITLLSTGFPTDPLRSKKKSNQQQQPQPLALLICFQTELMIPCSEYTAAALLFLHNL